jgi:hypothetical protein
MVPADRTMYRVSDQIIDQGMDLLDELRSEQRPEPTKLLKGSYPTQDAWKAAMAKLKVASKGTVSIKLGMETQDVKSTPHGEPWYDYLQKIQAAKPEGPEEISKVETLYDFLNDPYNKPKEGESGQKVQWWRLKEGEWDRIDLLHTRFEDNDWYPGTAGIPVDEIAGYRMKLDSLGDLDMETKNAIIKEIKNHPIADQGRALFQPILDKCSTRQGKIDVIKEWQPKTRSGIAYAEKVKAAEEAAAAERAASSSQSGT